MNADMQIRLFRKLMPYQLKLREIVRLLGPTEGKVCLDAGHDNAAMSKYLRTLGGTWSTVVRQESSRPVVEQAVGEKVLVFDGSSYSENLFWYSLIDSATCVAVRTLFEADASAKEGITFAR